MERVEEIEVRPFSPQFKTLYRLRRFVIVCPAPSTTISCYEKLDHFHFSPLFSGDDAGVVRKHSKFI
jgi:hypothetical protein